MRHTRRNIHSSGTSLFFRTAVLLFLAAMALTSHATTIRVPGDQPTIQAGIDAATHSDTVLVAPGVYTGPANRDITFGGKGIVLKSELGPALTIIDCQSLGRAFVLRGSVNSEPTIDGFTIINGEGGNQGGAIECFGFSPTIRYCVFADNKAKYGGALYFNGEEEKSAEEISSLPVIENCTFVGNSASQEGGVFYSNHGVSIAFASCLLTENMSGEGPPVGVGSGGGSITLTCCDLWGNEPGDWIGSISDQAQVNANFSDNPIFCRFFLHDYRIGTNSPCTPANSPCGQLVGAVNMDCQTCIDDDSDGICYGVDNCPFLANPDQVDLDSDGVGSLCDNCPDIGNPEQFDLNENGLGDACDDTDGDGVYDREDNCPWNYNPGQENFCCCIGRIGDANGLGGDEPTIGDLSVMIDAKFITGICEGIIACLAEADINQSGGCDLTCDDITISDMATLIDYLFITAWTLGLPECPDCP